MNLGIFAGSGYGKSWLTQIIIWLNLTDYDHVLVLDYCDEFRGLCSKEHGPAPCTQWIAGPTERDDWGPAEYGGLLAQNPKLILARHTKRITEEEWQEMAAAAIRGARRLDGSVLIFIDEAHHIAPQRGKVPRAVKELATTGRGGGDSCAWISQRPATVTMDVIGNTTARFLGGFNSESDADYFGDVVDYPTAVHNTNAGHVSGLPEELYTDDGEPLAVRKWTETTADGDKRTTASEWIYSDDDGKLARKHSDDYDPVCDHVGAAGKDIDVGV